jgi:hypothetical protein
VSWRVISSYSGSVRAGASRPRCSSQEAHLLAVAPRGDVHAHHAALVVQRRAAAHAGRQRAAEEDGGQEAAFGQAVVGAFDHGEAHVQRVAEREDALAARGRRVRGAELERAAAGQRGGVDRAQQGEVVHDVHRQQLQRALAAVGRAVDEAVTLRLQRDVADDVVVGDEVAGIADEEARADRRLAVLPAQQRANLHQPMARAFVDALARGRWRRGVG